MFFVTLLNQLYLGLGRDARRNLGSMLTSTPRA